MIIAEKDGAIFQLGLHREVWDFVSKNPDKSKENWPGWEKHSALQYCFACEATKWPNGRASCIKCPLCRHVSIRSTSSCLGGLYLKWVIDSMAKDLGEASIIAAKIRDLPLCNGWKVSDNSEKF